MSRTLNRFYNEAVPNPNRLLLQLRLGLVALLMGLLAMGPFLHSHIGASVVSGFHMDGVRSLPLTDTADASALPSLQVSDDESPALGVATSLPKSDPSSLCVGDITALLAAALLACLVCLPRQSPAARPWALPVRTYQAGWPPPALAPPALSF